jgi:hypothetical protein
MAKIVFGTGTGIPHKSMADEFLTHRKCSEWWYCTGYLQNEAGRLFGYQFTLAWVKILGIRFHILICCVTDFLEQKHYNVQIPIFFSQGVTATSEYLGVGENVKLILTPNKYSSMGHMKLHMACEDFTLDTEMDAVKAPVWQCEDGVLQMGILNSPKERTYYFSFTNLSTTGNLNISGVEYNNLKGKTWFDRQGGTYSLTKPECNWEWFSLRFFDNSEVMLFAFPQDNFYDGTEIDPDGSYRRLNDYVIKPTKIITYQGMKFSCGWEVSYHNRKYKLIPMIDGMFNLFFFELLALIQDEKGNNVGYCFVELLPGVRNKNNILAAFMKKV